MRKSIAACCAAVAVCLLSVAQGPPGQGAIAPLKFTDTHLDNGLRVIISEDHYAPLYSVAVTYNAGSRDERQGRTGFAHLFEHMMFKGSEKVGPGEHFFLVFNNGGNMNGSTNNDITYYYETLPKNQLDLGLFLESDRMRSLVLTKENLDNQRSAVQEERRLRVDNEPYGRTEELLEEMVYDNFAYKHSVIGSMQDLNAASLEDVRGFFKTYYAPNNATIVLVGDLNTADTLARIKKYFGDIPRQEPPPKVDMTEPPQRQERRARLEDKLARLPRLDMAWIGPFGNTPDAHALTVLATIFSSGQSSRLYQSLVQEKEAALSVGGYFGQRRGASIYQITATPRPGRSLEELEALISGEIARLVKEPPSEGEMLKLRNGARRSAVQTRENSLMLAVSIGRYATFWNDPGLINTDLDKILAVKAADVARVAGTYLDPSRRTVIYTTPAGGR
jgi:zinc protease